MYSRLRWTARLKTSRSPLAKLKDPPQIQTETNSKDPTDEHAGQRVSVQLWTSPSIAGHAFCRRPR